MKNSRRKFLKNAGMAGLGLAGSRFLKGASLTGIESAFTPSIIEKSKNDIMTQDNNDLSLIGQYGKWATTLANDKVPALSFRRKEFD